MKKVNGKKVMCITLSTAMIAALAGCGEQEAQETAVITEENQEHVLQEVLQAQVSSSHSSEAGKEETVYVMADAEGGVNQVIVSDWLKNSDGGSLLKDRSDLRDIQNVKGYEEYEVDENGDLVWKTEGSDIYYRGSSDKEVPVDVKISYQLDGQEITPEELAGKSGRVSIRMEYENKESRNVVIGDQEQEIKVPFVMISGMVLPQDTFSDITVTNARLLSEGNNSVVVGVAFPGLRESMDIDGLKEKLDDPEQKEKLDDVEIPDYIEIEADVEDFELGMTMTVAMSDILADIELTDSIDLSDINDSMDELKDATEQLKDGTVELKDGSSELKEGTEELLSGTGELWDGVVELKDGTQELYDKSGLLDDGAVKLDDGAAELYNGTVSLQDGVLKLNSGAKELKDGGGKLADGTGALLNGTKSLNDGALLVKDGVNQVAVQMNTLKAGIGTPVTSPEGLDPSNPTTLLQVSYLLNQSLKKTSEADGLAEAYYNGIISQLQQKQAQVQEDLSGAQERLAAAQGKAAAAQEELAAACQAETREVEIVTGVHTEETQQEVTVEAPVYQTTRVVTEKTVEETSADEGEESAEGGTVTTETTEENTEMFTETVTETVSVEKEVVDTEVIQVQEMDVENLQQKIDAYRSAVEEAAVCQAEVNAYAMQAAAAEEELAAAQAYAQDQMTLMQKWAPSITYAAVMEQKLTEISGALNSQESTMGMTALVKGVGDLADGTQSAYTGAKELNSGAKELKKGLDTLNDGTGELKDGAGKLKDGAETLKNGTGELRDGTGQLVEGTHTLNDGAGELKDGVNTLKDGVLTLDEGMGTMDEGVFTLMDGMFEFDEEGISKLTELFGDDVQDVIDRLEAVADSGKEYNTFTKLPENVDGSVKFIIKTEAIKKEE